MTQADPIAQGFEVFARYVTQHGLIGSDWRLIRDAGTAIAAELANDDREPTARERRLLKLAERVEKWQPTPLPTGEAE